MSAPTLQPRLSTTIVFSLLLFAALHAVDPTTSITAASNGSTYTFGGWTRSSVLVNLTCSAGGSDCGGISYCIDTANACDIAAGTRYSGTINVSSEGTQYLRYSSNNTTGGWGENYSSVLKIDFTSPSASINDGASGSWTNNDTISLDSTDSHSGLSIVKWVARIDSTCGPAQDAELDANGTEGSTLRADNETRFLGKYICFRAQDGAGNRNYAASSQLTRIDSVQPTVDAGPDRVENAQFTTSASASDSSSGIASYAWSYSSSAGTGTVSFGSRTSEDTTVSANADGTYTIILTVRDNAGNSGTDSFFLNWTTRPPELSISNPGTTPSQSKTLAAVSTKGTLTMSITTGTACDSSLTFTAYASTTFTSDSDNGKRICYRAIDDAGNAAYNLSDAISGIRTKKPTITLLGAADVTVEAGASYEDAGATAADGYGNDLTASLNTSNAVDTSKVGAYTVTYDATDEAGNAAEQKVRKVTVADTTKPTITLKGNSSVKLALNDPFTDAGATAADSFEGDLTSKINATGTVDTSKVGTYTITYDVSDAAGNKADQVTRTVVVEDSMLGIILLILAALLLLALVVAGIVAVYFLFIRKKGL